MMRAALVLGLLAVAVAERGTPIEEVVKLLEDLQSGVEEEGKTEAATYDKFACFCKDNSDSKTKSITENSTEINLRVSELEQHRVDEKVQTEEIAKQTGLVTSKTNELDAENNRWDKYHAQYQADHADVAGAVRAAEGAIKTLEKSKQGGGASLLQMPWAENDLKRTLALADAMGLVDSKQSRVAAFLQGVGDENPYDFHSDDVINMVKKLKGDFEKKKTELETEFGRAEKAHNGLVEGLGKEIEAAEEALSTNEELLAKTQTDIADKTKETTDRQASVHDDKMFLEELTKSCAAKAKLFDQRTAMRAQELTALTQAIGVLKDEVVTRGDVIKRALLQQPSYSPDGEITEAEAKEPRRELTPSEERERDDLEMLTMDSDDYSNAELAVDVSDQEDLGNDMEDTDADMDAADDSQEDTGTDGLSDAQSDSFLQLQTHVRRVRRADVSRVLELLDAEKSPRLSTLAMAIRKNPFTKIKKLIQELIERLLKESKDEATKEGWCQTEMAKSKKARGYAHEKAKSAMVDIKALTTTRAELEASIEKLNEEIPALQKSLKEATEDRNKEREENEKDISTAEEGEKGVAKALAILKDFYRDAGNTNFQALVQESPVGYAAPDAGFDDVYKGDQTKSTGVIGLLEVILSDFQRSIKQTAAAEAESLRNYVELSRATKVSIGEKETALRQASEDLLSTKANLSSTIDTLKEQQGMLDLSLQELQKLTAACIQTGMTFEERKAAREREIKALERAKEILKGTA